MKRLLIQLDSDRLPSSFDSIVAYDGGADEVLSYGGVGPADVRDLIHGAIFTRGLQDLKHTAVFVGGSSVAMAEEMLERAREAFFGPFHVSLMLDPNGSNTTAVAAVAKLESAAGGAKGKRVLILGGSGAVGSRVAGLFAGAGAEVHVGSRDQEAAERAASAIGRRFNCAITSHVTDYPLGPGSILEEADIVLASGPPGIQLVEREGWGSGRGPKVLGDVNAVPPLGVDGIEPTDDGEKKDGAVVFGALGIGNLKMKLHKACIARLFETKDLILDAETIYEVAHSL